MSSSLLSSEAFSQSVGDWNETESALKLRSPTTSHVTAGSEATRELRVNQQQVNQLVEDVLDRARRASQSPRRTVETSRQAFLQHPSPEGVASPSSSVGKDELLSPTYSDSFDFRNTIFSGSGDEAFRNSLTITSSVNSSDSIIRRVEQEIENARLAAAESMKNEDIVSYPSEEGPSPADLAAILDDHFADDEQMHEILKSASSFATCKLPSPVSLTRTSPERTMFRDSGEEEKKQQEVVDTIPHMGSEVLFSKSTMSPVDSSVEDDERSDYTEETASDAESEYTEETAFTDAVSELREVKDASRQEAERGRLIAGDSPRAADGGGLGMHRKLFLEEQPPMHESLSPRSESNASIHETVSTQKSKQEATSLQDRRHFIELQVDAAHSNTGSFLKGTTGNSAEEANTEIENPPSPAGRSVIDLTGSAPERAATIIISDNGVAEAVEASAISPSEKSAAPADVSKEETAPTASIQEETAVESARSTVTLGKNDSTHSLGTKNPSAIGSSSSMYSKETPVIRGGRQRFLESDVINLTEDDGTCSEITEVTEGPSGRLFAAIDVGKLKGSTNSLQSIKNKVARKMGANLEQDAPRQAMGDSRAIAFRYPYPSPTPLPQPRPSGDIVKENSLGLEPVDVIWTKPKPDLKQLLSAVMGPSLARRSNACGALKVLTMDKKNQLTLVKTTGFLEALVFAADQEIPEEDEEVALDARTRAVACLLRVVEPKHNRKLVFQFPGLMKCLVTVLQEDHGEARVSACAAIALLAKTVAIRERLVAVDHLLDLLSSIAKGTIDDDLEDASFDEGSADGRPALSTSYSETSSSDESHHSVGVSSSTLSSRKVKGPEGQNGKRRSDCIRKQHFDLYDEHLARSRTSACATLSHLSKHCPTSANIAENPNVVDCLVSVAREFDNSMHTKCLEIICHMTRFPASNAILARNRSLVEVLIMNGKSKSSSDRLWSLRTLQNLSTDSTSKVILATGPILNLLSISAMRPEAEEQSAAISTLYNLSTEPGAVVPLTNTKNVVATMVHVAHNPESSSEVRQMACDALATIGLWLQTLAGIGKVPEDVKKVPLPSHATTGWARWD